ncbi:glycosyltransferase family 2 protein [Roseibium aggregatum]|uniref:Glycosyltransferase family 2 protein n=1 Tax=Roseibium aggregatum TaxID=187304 RepID=A0A939J2T2_9HYPH|nr:glycosyltransferase family 2 protein [Roseibium aggregatum]MBN9669867.1 glycosyltransferase family 2 protein [Roseibium aggregatum]
MQRDMAPLSVIIISYNTADLTLQALKTLYDTTLNTEFSVIVFDNNSNDGSADRIEAEFPQATLIRNSENIGFAAGNNEAIKHSNSEWLLLLNPDTECKEGAVDNLMAFASANPGAGIYGGRTVFADGSLNPTSCWRFMSLWSLFTQAIGLSRIFKNSDKINWEAYGGWKRDSVREIEIVTGCFFLTRRDLWESLQGFDTDFFMYAEEADYCYRAREQGLKGLFTPEATILHYGGASEPVRSDKMVRLLKAKVHFLRKHWPRHQAGAGEWLFRLHVLVRFFCFSVLSLFKRSPSTQASRKVWSDIWTRRREWLTN